LDFGDLARPAATQPRQEYVSNLILNITARVTIEDKALGTSAFCMGFVNTRDEQRTYVVTARHCFEPFPLSWDVKQATVHYHAVKTGSLQPEPQPLIPGDTILWSYHDDLAILSVSAAYRGPVSYREVCACAAYGGKSFRKPERMPVLSVLSAGGGPAVVSSGELVSDAQGKITVFLPAAEGSSGSPVLDLHGNLVGIIVAGRVLKGSEAGWNTTLVPGHAVENLICDAVNRAVAGTYLDTPRGCLHR
jgi:hypothetical protein